MQNDGVQYMIFAECLRWTPDSMPESTDAVVVVSSCGTIVKRLEYKKWNEKNVIT